MMRYTRTMAVSFRQIVKLELRRRGWSGYRLAKETGLPIRSVQVYLSAQCDMSGERLAAVCDVLGLELKRRSGRKDG